MSIRSSSCSIVFGLYLSCITAAQGVTVQWVTVGDPGNPGTEFVHETLGSVQYAFRVSAYEVTNAQYAEFLNNVDPSGTNPLGLYNPLMGSNPRGGIAYSSSQLNGTKYTVRPNMGNKPVNYVNWFDSARFTNWLNNGQAGASTETGAYDMANLSYQRSSSAIVFLPSRDEWIKAGFYDPRSASEGGPAVRSHYWIYPTMSDTVPSDVVVDAMGNVTNSGPNVSNSNHSADWNGQDGNLTTVGSAESVSYYGTYDQAGNVKEWTEDLIPWCCGTPDCKGGDWNFSQVYNNITNLGNKPALSEDNTIGFRVATVIPEPAAAALVAIGCLFVFMRRR